jgi:hypothetical protein
MEVYTPGPPRSDYTLWTRVKKDMGRVAIAFDVDRPRMPESARRAARQKLGEPRGTPAGCVRRLPELWERGAGQGTLASLRSNRLHDSGPPLARQHIAGAKTERWSGIRDAGATNNPIWSRHLTALGSGNLGDNMLRHFRSLASGSRMLLTTQELPRNNTRNIPLLLTRTGRVRPKRTGRPPHEELHPDDVRDTRAEGETVKES